MPNNDGVLALPRFHQTYTRIHVHWRAFTTILNDVNETPNIAARNDSLMAHLGIVLVMLTTPLSSFVSRVGQGIPSYASGQTDA